MEEDCPLLGAGFFGEVDEAVHHLGNGRAALLLLAISAAFGVFLPQEWHAIVRWLLGVGITGGVGVGVAVLAARRGYIYAPHWQPTAAANAASVRFSLGSRHDHGEVIRELRVRIITPLGARYDHCIVQEMRTGVGVDLYYPDTLRKHGTRFAHGVVPGTYYCRWEGRHNEAEPWTVVVASVSATVR